MDRKRKLEVGSEVVALGSRPKVDGVNPYTGRVYSQRYYEILEKRQGELILGVASTSSTTFRLVFKLICLSSSLPGLPVWQAKAEFTGMVNGHQVNLKGIERIWVQLLCFPVPQNDKITLLLISSSLRPRFLLARLVDGGTPVATAPLSKFVGWPDSIVFIPHINGSIALQ